MFDLLSGVNQGWYLTILSSLLCALGTLIIFVDDIYYFLLPKGFTSRHPFNLKENYAFMNGSLAFSSGCLIFTALYKLLPEALQNLKSKHGHLRSQNMDLIFSFIGGILACFLFNQALHLLTAESVVHCSHDGEDHIETLPYSELVAGQEPHDHGHSHSHADNHSHSHADNHDHGHDHGHQHEPRLSDFDSVPQSIPSIHSHLHDDHSPSRHSHDSNAVDMYQPDTTHYASTAEDLESAPLLGHRKSLGLLHYFSGAEQDENLLGECKGYSSAELCLHSKDKLHFCELPQLPEGLAHHQPGSSDDSRSVHSKDLSVKSKTQGDVTLLEVHSHHVRSDHHHHHVNSPLSRLLLIGIQTILAITLHKFPEGFITYITSETNPDLGLSIFLSLLIHNFTEGFSMCLPLYYSFASSKGGWSKLKAVSISGILGGFSQPLGAFMGLLFMKANHADSDNIDLDKLSYIFGITIAVTSGFLSVIALSMYGSAVAFSGSSNFVMVWCIIGMCVIGLSSAFINH